MNDEKAHTSCLQRLDALEANVQVQIINHQRLRSRVQMATCHREHGSLAVRTALGTSVYAKMASQGRSHQIWSGQVGSARARTIYARGAWEHAPPGKF